MTKSLNQTHKKTAKSLLFFCSSLLLLICSIAFAVKANIYHGELDVYLPHYLGNKPVLNIIFDPICELDLTGKSFRGREIGNAFNYLDAQALSFLFKYNIPAFVSPIYYACLTVVAILFCLSIDKRNFLQIQLLLLLFLSSPPVLFGGIFYRTNKIISATSILFSIILVHLIKSDRHLEVKRKTLPALLLLCSILASLSDEQGFVIIVVIFLWDILRSFKKPLNLDTTQKILIGSILFTMGYRSFLGPYLFHIINGVNPSIPEINTTELLNSYNLLASINLLFVYTNYLIGNFNPGLKTLSIMWISFFFLVSSQAQQAQDEVISKRNMQIISTIWIAISLVLIIHVMTLKHPAIFWPDIVSYYSLPIIFFLFGMLYIYLDSVNLKREGAKYLSIILTLLIISNIMSWQQNFTKIINGHIKIFRVGTHVTQAVYSSPEESKKILSSISYDGDAPGKKKEMNLGELGTEAIKNSLHQNQRN